ncbi:ABC transporter ATP-binding protein [Streptomyces olivaceiscleroticus]|uniref:ABC transporter ATP-binding protein n=1 Tax=Streptomyces olivaceiscleroticus TaxID=68245 RepID=A0ABP3JUK7_9ACTN
MSGSRVPAAVSRTTAHGTPGDPRPPAPARRTGTVAARVLAAAALAVKAAPGLLVLYMMVELASGGLPVVIAWLTKEVLDGLVGGAATSALLPLGAGLAGAGVLTGTLPQAGQYLQAETDRRVSVLAQDRLFTSVEGFTGLGRFEDPRFLDRLRLAQQYGGTVPSRVVDGTLGTARAVITIGGFLGSLLLLSPLMTALVLLSALPALAGEIVLSRQRARMFWKTGPIERREFFFSALLTSVEAAKEIRLYGSGAFLRGRMLAERRTANAAKRAMDRREFLVESGLAAFAALVSGGGLVWAVFQARTGALSVGDVTLFIAAVAGVQSALTQVAANVAQAHQALLMFEHYQVVTAAGPDLPVPAGPRALPPLRHGIELRDVWFRYSDDHPWVLRGVDLRIPYGTTLALVGLNGAGKSTLVKLVCRLYDPVRGAVLWDGVNIRDIDPAELRHRIGAVFQDYMHYDMTATENIALGDLSSLNDSARLQAAAKRAGVHDKLAGLPRGYDTLLSRTFMMETDKEDPATGVALSGGQWQRLALARAFLRDRRDLMILDEPSAGLDAEAEHEIHSSIAAYRGTRTSLLISHRLNAVRDADRIAVLSEGRVVEEGTHDALMARGRWYARLFTLQSAGYRSDAADSGAPTNGGRPTRTHGRNPRERD